MDEITKNLITTAIQVTPTATSSIIRKLSARSHHTHRYQSTIQQTHHASRPLPQRQKVLRSENIQIKRNRIYRTIIIRHQSHRSMDLLRIKIL